MPHAGSPWIVAVAGAAVLGAGAVLRGRPAAQAEATATTHADTVTFPQRLSETGLYGIDGRVDPRNRSFTPQYPLWTDGATKQRWVRLPDGGKIDARDPDGWRFPAGTTFWKEFAWRGRKVETRMIRMRADGSPSYATYAWNAEGTDAMLVPADGIPRSYEISRGKWHAIPAAADCRGCHESGPSNILGFSALQLSDDRDPLAPHAEPVTASSLTLRTLVDEDRLQPAQPTLATHPPRIRARNEIERAALGYLSSNCGTCHNTRGPLSRLGFSLRHDFPGVDRAHEPAIETAIGNAGRFALPGDHSGSRLIEPGLPKASAVMHRMMSRRAATQMPPIGTVIVDSAGAAVVRQWISRLH
jgi:hypothetical protein